MVKRNPKFFHKGPTPRSRSIRSSIRGPALVVWTWNTWRSVVASAPGPPERTAATAGPSRQDDLERDWDVGIFDVCSRTSPQGLRLRFATRGMTLVWDAS